MKKQYKEVKMMGITCYTDAYIMRTDPAIVYLISLYGRVGVVKAISAAILERRNVFIENEIVSGPSNTMKSITQNLGKGLCHKVILCPDYFQGIDTRIILGQDKQRAFQFLGDMLSTPLKEEWADWLWSRVFDADPLTGFGFLESHDLTDVCAISVNMTVDEVDALVLDGISCGELN